MILAVVLESLFDAVIVWVVASCSVVGVPDIAQVNAFKLRPAGRKDAEQFWIVPDTVGTIVLISIFLERLNVLGEKIIVIVFADFLGFKNV